MNHSDLVDALIEAEAPIDASEVHGSFCGVMCDPQLKAAQWLDRWCEEQLGDPAPAALSAVLQNLAAELATQLQSNNLDLRLLLPDEDVDLDERSEALAAWCTGFLGGLGTHIQAQHLAEHADLAEALADLGRIARTSFRGQVQDDESEWNYAELVEFVRAAAMLIFAALAAQPPRAH